MSGKTVITPNRVISYHKVDIKNEIGITVVKPKKFRKQIEYLVQKGYKFVTLSELFFDNDEKKIAITFDDGYLNNYQYAFPILQEFGAVATVFIICSTIGKENDWDANLGGIKFQHLGDDEIKFLIDNGWEIGSHGITHYSLKNSSQKVLDYEIGKSKIILEEKYGQEIKYFSSPFGKINQNILKTCEKFGYDGCCGFYPIKLLNQKPEKMQIPRLAVYMGENTKTVERKLSREYKKIRREVFKQNFINFWNNATIAVKAIK